MREYTKLLRHLVALSGKSERQIAEHGGVDVTYVRRQLDGTKFNPGPEQLIRTAMGIIYNPTLYEKHRHEGNEALQDVLAHLTEALRTDQLADVIADSPAVKSRGRKR